MESGVRAVSSRRAMMVMAVALAGAGPMDPSVPFSISICWVGACPAEDLLRVGDSVRD